MSNMPKGRKSRRTSRKMMHEYKITVAGKDAGTFIGYKQPKIKVKKVTSKR